MFLQDKEKKKLGPRGSVYLGVSFASFVFYFPWKIKAVDQ